MSVNKRLMAACIIFFSLCAAGIAQTASQSIERARTLYNQGSYQEAFDLISSKVPETSDDAQLKSSAASFFVYVGVSELDFRNYRNAYTCFKKAVAYQPTNSVALKYLDTMEHSMNIQNLKNEGESGPASSIKPSAGSQASVSSSDLQALITQMWAEESKLTLSEKNQSYQKENSDLKNQLDQQRTLNQQTIELLTKIAEQQKPQVIVQSDPSLRALTTLMGDQNKMLEKGSTANTITVIALVALSLIFMGCIGFFVILAVRSKRGRGQPAAPGMPGMAGLPGFEALGAPQARPEALQAPERPLLEYLDSGKGAQGVRSDVDIQKQLVRAERLTRMLEAAKTNELSWDTVRNYLDELDTDLKAEILKTVENAIAEGDLMSNQAVLPIIFPFLTDYDEYLRERAEKAAASALLEDEGEYSEPKNGPFEIKALVKIPERLKAVLKGRDQSIVTAKLARSIGQYMGFSAEDCRSVYKAALAHDAGYLMLDKERLQSILSKTDITPEDFEYIKSHTVKGPSYFGEAEIPQEIRDAILYHHERNDGSGYPDGLKKEQIPLFARVIGVAESFAALMASRPHRDKIEMSNALAIIRDSRFKFDHDIVEALSVVVQNKGIVK